MNAEGVITGEWRGSLADSTLTERYTVEFHGDRIAADILAALQQHCDDEARRGVCQLFAHLNTAALPGVKPADAVARLRGTV